ARPISYRTGISTALDITTPALNRTGYKQHHYRISYYDLYIWLRPRFPPQCGGSASSPSVLSRYCRHSFPLRGKQKYMRRAAAPSVATVGSSRSLVENFHVQIMVLRGIRKL